MFGRFILFILITGIFIICPLLFYSSRIEENKKYDPWEKITCTVKSAVYKNGSLTVSYYYRYKGKRWSTGEGRFKSPAQGKALEKKYSEFAGRENAYFCFVNPQLPAAGPRSHLELPQKKKTHRNGVGASVLLGCIFYILLLKASIKAAKEKKLQTLHKSQPWKWRSEWQSGVVKNKILEETKGLLNFAIAWLTISLLVAFFIQGPITYIVMPIVGLAFLSFALMRYISFYKYPGAEFHIADGRGIIGGKISGELYLPENIFLQKKGSIELLCQKFVHAGGKQGGISKVTLWSQSLPFCKEDLKVEGNRNFLPVSFDIPEAMEESDFRLKPIRTRWLVQMKIPSPVISFTGNFDIPVFNRTNAEGYSSESA